MGRRSRKKKPYIEDDAGVLGPLAAHMICERPMIWTSKSGLSGTLAVKQVLDYVLGQAAAASRAKFLKIFFRNLPDLSREFARVDRLERQGFPVTLRTWPGRDPKESLLDARVILGFLLAFTSRL